MSAIGDIQRDDLDHARNLAARRPGLSRRTVIVDDCGIKRRGAPRETRPSVLSELARATCAPSLPGCSGGPSPRYRAMGSSIAISSAITFATGLTACVGGPSSGKKAATINGEERRATSAAAPVTFPMRSANSAQAWAFRRKAAASQVERSFRTSDSAASIEDPAASRLAHRIHSGGRLPFHRTQA